MHRSYSSLDTRNMAAMTWPSMDLSRVTLTCDKGWDVYRDSGANT